MRTLKRRDLKYRKFHSLVINYARGMAVRVNSAGNEIERLGDEGGGVTPWLPREKREVGGVVSYEND